MLLSAQCWPVWSAAVFGAGIPILLSDCSGASGPFKENPEVCADRHTYTVSQ